jgi:hypothetical protein
LTEDREQVLRAFDVSRETAQRLDAFIALLLKWQNTTGDTGRSQTLTLPAAYVGRRSTPVRGR